MADDSFFGPDDQQRIQAAAETDWGRGIVDAMREAVEERLRHSMEVPELEAGHFHHYFCPTHNRLLAFDWDQPTRHFCPECGVHLEGERYDHAWRVFVHWHNRVFMRNSAVLFIVTGDGGYLERIRSLLLAYAERYPHYRLHGHDMQFNDPWYGGRMFSQTLDEANWAVDVAPAYREALAVMTAEEAKEIEAGLLRPQAETILRNRAGGNWQVWHNAGLACIAVALGDDALLRTALEDPKHGYHAMMRSGVTAEGWWYERSPGYHFYPLDAMVRTAEAVRGRGIDLYDEQLRSMFTGPMQAVYSDLVFPAHNDGWHGVSLTGNAHLYEAAALRFNNEGFRELLAKAYARTERKHWTALLHGRAVRPDRTPLRLPSCVYPDTGVAYLRSDAKTVVLKFGPHGGGHGHPDKLSIAIHDGKREILPDLGTPGYGVPDHTHWYRRTLAHSTVVVDGKDQKATAGRLIGFEAAEEGGEASAECDSAYEGVTMRRALRLSGRRLEDSFVCEATAPHRFEYVLILAEPVGIPRGATAAELPAGGGYERIRHPKEWEVDGKAELSGRGFRLTISSPVRFSLIAGRAPGVPGTTSLKTKMEPCYPLIVRIEGERMEVETVWTLGK